MDILTIIISVAALVIGIIAGKFIFAQNTRKQVEEAEIQARKITAEIAGGLICGKPGCRLGR